MGMPKWKAALAAVIVAAVLGLFAATPTVIRAEWFAEAKLNVMLTRSN
jgi:hypothetical protein